MSEITESTVRYLNAEELFIVTQLNNFDTDCYDPPTEEDGSRRYVLDCEDYNQTGKAAILVVKFEAEGIFYSADLFVFEGEDNGVTCETND